MSNEQLFTDAITTLYHLGWAALAWLAVLAAVATIVLLAGTAVGAWAVSAVWRRTVGPSWARGALRARIHARARLRRSSGRTAAPDYEEAA
ncbi:hypothetical protein [Streptomyces sp. NPDC051016]|uniref:hypothetical protein n=1 Tax=Streptomyces sp. NPDC051016 TaxID=3365638 RepID=UPI0037B8831D